MARITQKSDGKGSLKNIQALINSNTNFINNLIQLKLEEFETDEIIWESPKVEDSYAEYRDEDFLKKVGLNPNEIQLAKFWPNRGPQWDALARTNKEKIILVEAKANISEIKSSSTKANDKSKSLILKSLNETKSFLNINNDVDWSKKFYQYANRLSHLYFLREKCNKQAFLVNVYFIGDSSVGGPKTEQEWNDALKDLNTYLGVSKHKLSRYMIDLFIDIKELNP